MKRILRSRLPERFAERVPAAVVEAAVGAATPVLLTFARLALAPWAADRAPYALVFVAVVAATVLAGWRSGLIAIVVGQLLAWYVIIDPQSYALDRAAYVGGLAIATFAEIVAVVIIWLYQREVDRAWLKREAQVDLLHQALAEIDHRTMNNYQTVQALVQAQARRSKGEAKEALQQVADRIRAIAMASKQLALSSSSLEQVRVTHHLGELCAQIREGLSRPGVGVECHFEDVALSAEEAIALSILVNELVTNALKHAFPDDRAGLIRVEFRRTDDSHELSVEDNGIGLNGNARTRGTGLGSRLVDTFVKQLGARHEVSSNKQGTRHLIRVPIAA